MKANKMKDFSGRSFNLDDPELISVIDELPLWSAPFGLRLLDMVRYRPGMNALDIGCGPGFPMIELAQRLGESSTVYGMDPWEAALARVKFKAKLLGLKNVTVVKGKAEKMPFEDSFFELIVSNNGLNNVDDIDAALSECSRVCRAGGQFVLTMNLPGTMKEFYDIFRAVLGELGKAEELRKLEEHIYAKRKPLEETTRGLNNAGFKITEVRQDAFTMKFTDGTAMLNHFLIRLAFLRPWKDVLREGDISAVFTMIEHRLNELSGKQGELTLTVPYVCIDCRKH